MAVQFILGASGSGKTSHCIQSVIRELSGGDPARSLILLVPEQATFQAERAILSDERIAGYHRLKVLSFDRLGFFLLGKNSGGAELSRLAREMIIHRILRAEGQGLRVFGQASRLPGMAAELAKTITELHECAKGPDDLKELIESLKKDKPDSLSALKLSDITLVFEKYLEFIEGKENRFINPDIRLTDACKAVGKADFLKGAYLWIDGFASFTIQQRDLLVEILKVASESRIALCLDPAKLDVNKPVSDPMSLFGVTERSYAELMEIVKKCKLALKEPIILNERLRFANSADLRHIEADLFSVEPAKPVKSNGDVSIAAAQEPRAEAVYAAKEITRLVRKCGYRYRDIAVIVSEMPRYQHYLEAALSDYDIPFFIDRPQPLVTHPVVELIVSGLHAATNGFCSSDVFAYFKTGLSPLENYQADLLENYGLAFGVDGDDWAAAKDWAFAEKDRDKFDEKQINAIRRKAIGPLSKLKDALSAGDKEEGITSEEFVCAVWEFINDLEVGKKLDEWSKTDTDDEKGHRQFYDKLVNIFDELSEIFGDGSAPAQDYVSILCSGFSELKLKLIPPKLDQVLIGSIERSRHPELKAVFLMGVTQKQFPVPVTFDSILTEEDRFCAEEHDFVLHDRLAQQLQGRQYLAYIAFTRPSERLYITYPLTDDGDPVVRSQFLNDLESLFVGLKSRAADVAEDIETVSNTEQLAGLVCERTGRDNLAGERQKEKLFGLIESMRRDSGLAETAERIDYALGYDNTAALEQQRCGPSRDVLNCSASRLSCFASCPFKHFVRYTLELKERKLFSFERVDLGSFYHRVLDGLFRRLENDGFDFATVDDGHLKKQLSGQIAELLAKDAFLSNFISRSAHNEYIIRSAGEVLQDSVRAYSRMSRAGKFRQKGSEIWFGGKDDKLRCRLELPDGHVVNLHGCIDRIDVADIDGKQTTAVFDYKRKGKSFSWENLYYGLDMQLAIYLLALKNGSVGGKKIDSPAGAFYLPIEAKLKTGTLNKADQKEEKFDYTTKGFLDGEYVTDLDNNAGSGWNKYYNFYMSKDGPYGNFKTSGALKPGQLEKVLDMTRSRIAELAGYIFAGRINITPYRINKKSPCVYCPYDAVCRFDWQINRYNLLSPMNKELVLKMAGGGDGG